MAQREPQHGPGRHCPHCPGKMSTRFSYRPVRHGSWHNPRGEPGDDSAAELHMLFAKYPQIDATDLPQICFTFIPNMSTPEALSVPRELDTVTNLLDEHIDSLAYGNCSVQNAALQAAKHIFDTCTL
jgi:hypothetical protein